MLSSQAAAIESQFGVTLLERVGKATRRPSSIACRLVANLRPCNLPTFRRPHRLSVGALSQQSPFRLIDDRIPYEQDVDDVDRATVFHETGRATWAARTGGRIVLPCARCTMRP